MFFAALDIGEPSRGREGQASQASQGSGHGQDSGHGQAGQASGSGAGGSGGGGSRVRQRRPSERITKTQLGKRVITEDGQGLSSSKPVTLE